MISEYSCVCWEDLKYLKRLVEADGNECVLKKIQAEIERMDAWIPWNRRGNDYKSDGEAG